MTSALPMPTFADAFRPARVRAGWTYEVVLVLLGSLAIAASARVAIPLPFTPVMVTGQTFAVLLVGALYGSRRGALTVLAYLGQGMVGLPVFMGGLAGPAHLLGPTGGYLVGFVAAAFVVGVLAERGWDRRPLTTALAMTLGTAIIFGAGLARLAFLDVEALLATGLLPFLPGAVVKIALATAVLPLGWRAMAWLQGRV